MVSAEKALISLFFFRNSLLLTLPWIIISCKWKVHLRSVFVWSCHISSLNCLLSSPPPSPPPLQPQSIILVSPLIIHLRSSLPPKRLQTNWSECKYGPSLDFCYLFYHFLRWLNSNPDIWFLNHISNLRPCVWNGMEICRKSPVSPSWSSQNQILCISWSLREKRRPLVFSRPPQR